MVSKSSKRPNVVVFFTDQQRWDSMGLHGNPLGLTPNLDRMAMQGTHLFNAFTPQPVCGPARSCFQTGQYATNTGVYRNGLGLKDDAVTMAHCFGEGGYQTAYIGKWHLAGTGNKLAVPKERRGGYEYWLGAEALEMSSDAYRAVMYDGDDKEVLLPGYRVDAQTDAVIRYIDQAKDDPFFLFISYLEPHFQNHLDDFPPPDGYREAYAGRWIPPDLAALGGTAHQHLGGYWGMCKRLDEAFGRLLDALKSLQILDNTIVLFTSDHGCHFKTRNGEYKRSCHESSMRIPMAMRGPGFDGGGRVENLISLLDLPPTLLDACGLPIPETMEGRSFLPQLRGADGEDWPEEVFAQISEAQVARTVRTRRWKYCVDAPGADAWEDSASDRYVESELYDLEFDPYELTNLIGMESHQETARVMRERLLRRMSEAGEKEPKIDPAPTRDGGQRVVSRGEARE